MKTFIAATFAAVTFAATAHAAPVLPFSSFVGFGDSLSDKGRQFDHGDPYLEGRFSNGKTWMELLGEEFESQSLPNFNLALGGATAGSVNTNDPAYNLAELFTTRDPLDPDDIPLIDLGTFDRQITSFVNAGFNTLVGDNPLVGLLFGGNDFIQQAGTNPAFNPVDVATDIVDGVRRIADLDPSFDDFLVLNLPDVSATPGSAGLNPLDKALLQGAVLQFNFELETQLGQLASDKGLDIEVFDLFGFNAALAVDFEAMGIDVTGSCVTDPLCTTIDDADDFFFVDNVHPNRLVNSEISAAVLPLVQSSVSPVPLPAGMPLVLLGLGVFGVMRVTRKPAA